MKMIGAWAVLAVALPMASLCAQQSALPTGIAEPPVLLEPVDGKPMKPIVQASTQEPLPVSPSTVEPIVPDGPYPQPADLAPFATFLDPKANEEPKSPPRMWGSMEILAWWTKGIPVNTPLLTQATNYPADPTSGSLGSKNTDIILGDQSYATDIRYGGRLTLGGWFSEDRLFGLEGNYLYIAPQYSTQSVSGTGSIVYGLPYFDVNSHKEAMAPLTGPASLFGSNVAGGAGLRLGNFLEGGELNLIARLYTTDHWDVIGLAGFRYLNFTEELDYTASNTITGTPGQQSTLQDSFHAGNNFYGGQLGLRGIYHNGDLFVDATGKLALGSMNQVVNVNGSAGETNPGSPPAFNFTNAQGGFIAQPTNIGVHTQSVFCVLPEIDLKVGYNLTRNIAVFLGYNFLYLSNVARPGTLIDHNINPTQVPGLAGFPNTLTGPAAPNFAFNRTDFWAQGLSFGLQFTY